MGRPPLFSTPLLLLDLEELNISETLTALSRLYDFACGSQSFAGEVGQALVHAVLSQCCFFRKSERSFL